MSIEIQTEHQDDGRYGLYKIQVTDSTGTEEVALRPGTVSEIQSVHWSTSGGTAAPAFGRAPQWTPGDALTELGSLPAAGQARHSVQIEAIEPDGEWYLRPNVTPGETCVMYVMVCSLLTRSLGLEPRRAGPTTTVAGVSTTYTAPAGCRSFFVKNEGVADAVVGGQALEAGRGRSYDGGDLTGYELTIDATGTSITIGTQVAS
jgi:hypothetical protein